MLLMARYCSRQALVNRWCWYGDITINRLPRTILRSLVRTAMSEPLVGVNGLTCCEESEISLCSIRAVPTCARAVAVAGGGDRVSYGRV